LFNTVWWFLIFHRGKNKYLSLVFSDVFFLLFHPFLLASFHPCLYFICTKILFMFLSHMNLFCAIVALTMKFLLLKLFFLTIFPLRKKYLLIWEIQDWLTIIVPAARTVFGMKHVLIECYWVN
jgi:hypothetical protein